MEGLNTLSTFGTHPKEFDPEQVRPILLNLVTIIKWFVKYKDTQTISQEKTGETKFVIKEPVEVKEGIKKLKQRMIFLFSGILLVVVIVVAALFVFHIVGSKKEPKEIEKSIAVLPFINDSPNEENTYFINGIMETILDNLCKIQDLMVIARTSVEQYRNAPKTVTEIANELNVNYILEGSGQQYENKIRLTVQLINGKNGKHIWSNQYNRELNDIFSVQSEIAQLIAEELKVIITPEEKQLIEKTPTSSLTAYDFFQRGREEHWKYNLKGDREALEKAEDMYYEALKYDSTFAQAYTGLAWAYWNKHYWETFLTEEFLDSVMILCNIALSYDDQLSEAYAFRGAYYYATGKREKAIKEFDNAIKFNPNDWMAYWQRASSYYNYDQVKSIDNYNKAVSLNRGEQLPVLLRNLGSAYLDVGFIDKARYYYREAFLLDRDSAQYLDNLRWMEFSFENFEESIKLIRQMLEIDSTRIFDLVQYSITSGLKEEAYFYAKKKVDYFEKYGTLDLGELHRIGYAFYQVGKTVEAEHYFQRQIKYCNESIKLGRSYAQNKSAQYDLAGVYAFLGDKKKAYQFLDEFNIRNFYPLWWVTLIKYDPLFSSIRNEERFQKILQNVEAKYQAEHERVRKWMEEQEDK